MVRLLAVQVSIAALKRALAISSKLKPSAWVCLAFTQAVLAVLSFWAYRQQSRQLYVRSREESITSISVVKSTTRRRVYRRLSSRRLSALRRTYRRPIGQARILNSYFRWSGRRGLSTAAGSYQVFYYRASRSGWMDNWFYRRLPKFQPTFVSQPAASGGTSLLDTVVKLMLLFQAIIFTIGSAASSAFLYLNYQRGKLDLKLKELQVRELENMERERVRAVKEAAHSGIVLLS